MRYSLIMLLLTIGLFQTDRFSLKADLIKDKKRLAEEHGVHINVKDLSQFEKYAAMDLSKFSVSKKVVNNNSVVKWTSKSSSKLVVFKIETVLAGDTIFNVGKIGPVTNRQANGHEIIKLNPRDYVYYTYIIVPEKGDKLVYMREKNEGIVEYRIGGKKYQPIRESILLGQNYPDLDNLVKTVLSLK